MSNGEVTVFFNGPLESFSFRMRPYIALLKKIAFHLEFYWLHGLN